MFTRRPFMFRPGFIPFPGGAGLYELLETRLEFFMEINAVLWNTPLKRQDKKRIPRDTIKVQLLNVFKYHEKEH